VISGFDSLYILLQMIIAFLKMHRETDKNPAVRKGGSLMQMNLVGNFCRNSENTIVSPTSRRVRTKKLVNVEPLKRI
jgi:hypothetical protein